MNCRWLVVGAVMCATTAHAAAGDNPNHKEQVRAALKAAARVNTVRVFEDGPFVFAHSEYEAGAPKIGIDVFRFEGGKIVEHWENVQAKPAHPNPSGRDMIGGPATPRDLAKSAANKELVRAFVTDILMGAHRERLGSYFAGDHYIQHNPNIGDGVASMAAAFKAMAAKGLATKHDRIRQILGEGDFVLSVSEGTRGGVPTSFYNLFRIEDGKIAEHWDTIESIPRGEWKNDNGKF